MHPLHRTETTEIFANLVHTFPQINPDSINEFNLELQLLILGDSNYTNILTCRVNLPVAGNEGPPQLNEYNRNTYHTIPTFLP